MHHGLFFDLVSRVRSDPKRDAARRQACGLPLADALSGKLPRTRCSLAGIESGFHRMAKEYFAMTYTASAP